MKIAFVSDSVYPWNVGGVETMERTQADALSKGNELHFFSLRWPGMRSEFVKDGIQYHTFHDIDRKRFYRHGRRSIREAVAFAFGMFRIFGYRFDVIHSNQFPILQLPVLKFYCMITGCKLIAEIHEVWDKEYWTTYLGGFKGTLANSYSNWALGMADHYVANASATESSLVRLGVPRSRITVFAPTIEDKVIASVKAKPTKTKEIIFAGRLIKEKRLDRWLDAFAKVAKQVNVRGLIIGDGPELHHIRSLIKKMQLTNKVEVRGFYSEERKRELFKRIKEASLFLHMSEREGLGIVALESIALGTPVLLPSYTPIPPDVKDMCIVADERKLPDVATKIIKGKKSDYIRNSQRISLFYDSRVVPVYREIFRKMGLQ